MNDQIAKTLNQPAFDRLKDWYDIGPVQKATLELFAELIVRECLGCCDEVDRINKAYIEKLQFDPKNGPKECIQVIKEHFGVEE